MEPLDELVTTRQEVSQEGDQVALGNDVRCPDYRPVRLKTLQQEIACHERRKTILIKDDRTYPDDVRAALLTYHDMIIAWLQERITALKHSYPPVRPSSHPTPEALRSPRPSW